MAAILNFGGHFEFQNGWHAWNILVDIIYQYAIKTFGKNTIIVCLISTIQHSHMKIWTKWRPFCFPRWPPIRWMKKMETMIFVHFTHSSNIKNTFDWLYQKKLQFYNSALTSRRNVHYVCAIHVSFHQIHQVGIWTRQ